jgi:hypothetical protein
MQVEGVTITKKMPKAKAKGWRHLVASLCSHTQRKNKEIMGTGKKFTIPKERMGRGKNFTSNALPTNKIGKNFASNV